MDWAKKAFKERSEQLNIHAEMGLGAFYTQLGRFYDQLTMSISRDVGDLTLKSIYALLIQQAKRSSDQTDYLASPAVFIEAGPEEAHKKPPRYWGLFAVAALLLAGLAAWLIFKVQILLAVIACAAFALLLSFCIAAALKSRNTTRVRPKVRAEERLNPAKILRALELIASAIDGDAENLYGMLVVPAAQESVDGIELAAAVLRVSVNEPDALPMELNSAVTAYFSRHDIKTVMYSPENSAMFTVLPSNGDRTIEPALVMKDKLLKAGVACTKGV